MTPLITSSIARGQLRVSALPEAARLGEDVGLETLDRGAEFLEIC